MNTCSAKRLDARRIKAKKLRIGYQTLSILDFRFWNDLNANQTS